jgi:hypothetical protein
MSLTNYYPAQSGIGEACNGLDRHPSAMDQTLFRSSFNSTKGNPNHIALYEGCTKNDSELALCRLLSTQCLPVKRVLDIVLIH